MKRVEMPGQKTLEGLPARQQKKLIYFTIFREALPARTM